jgi:hypothetical protein
MHKSPNPAFTPAQYDRLALLYVIASARSQHWLIPAYHAALDADIPNGHDDPLNFDPESFAENMTRSGTCIRWIRRIRTMMHLANDRGNGRVEGHERGVGRVDKVGLRGRTAAAATY